MSVNTTLLAHTRSPARDLRATGKGRRVQLGLATLALASVLSASASAVCTGSSPTWTSTVDYGSLSSCVSQAKSRDTINVSAGTATYSSTLLVTKGISIIGAGPTSTIINGNNTTVIVINMTGSENVRISNIGFTGSGGDTQLAITMINLRGTLDTIRLDHLNFTDIQQHAVYIGLWDAIPQHPRVLFDHITYKSSLVTGFQRFLKLLGNNNTWKFDDQYGSDWFVFIEDSSFTWTGVADSNSGVTDTEHGGRLVVRYNTIQGGGVQVHDTGSTPAAKGQRLTEIYRNAFACNIPHCSEIPAIGVRGGGWVIHGNRFDSGFWVPAYPQIYRATVEAGYLGKSCDGTPVAVCDTPTYYHCSGGDHRACGYPDDFICQGIGSCVTAASGPSDCSAQSPFIPNLDRVDGGAGLSGYPCRHQTGWGKEIANGQMEEPSPVYWWNNTDLSGAPVSFSFDVSPWFLANRDYCNHDPSTACGRRVGFAYTPFPYPHPLQSGTGYRLPPPTNLRIQ